MRISMLSVFFMWSRIASVSSILASWWFSFWMLASLLPHFRNLGGAELVVGTKAAAFGAVNPEANS
jgi:hypothetical protein